MPDTTRTFVALAVPDTSGERLARFQERLAPAVSGVRWNKTGSYHLTLAFLGDVAHADLHAVCLGVAGTVAETGPLALRIEGLGVFPNATRPRVLWAGVLGAGLDALLALQKGITRATASVGYPSDEGRFQPHVTLGYLKPGRGPAQDLSPILKRYHAWSAGAFMATEVITFASTLTPDGPVYTPLNRARLLGRNPGTSP